MEKHCTYFEQNKIMKIKNGESSLYWDVHFYRKVYAEGSIGSVDPIIYARQRDHNTRGIPLLHILLAKKKISVCAW